MTLAVKKGQQLLHSATDHLTALVQAKHLAKTDTETKLTARGSEAAYFMLTTRG